MYTKFKPPFFWPEEYRQTWELSIAFLLDDEPNVACLGGVSGGVRDVVD
jgi:hypothetical protein